jgi:electron transport complex protein RnfG
MYYIGKIGSTELGVVTACAPKGYGGPIKFLAAFDFDGRVKGVKILSLHETPGLGAKAVEINPLMVEKKSAKFQNPNMDKNKPWFTEQFNSLSLDELYLTKDNPEGKVDAITAATITSRAITNGLRKKLSEFLKLRKML